MPELAKLTIPLELMRGIDTITQSIAYFRKQLIELGFDTYETNELTQTFARKLLNDSGL